MRAARHKRPLIVELHSFEMATIGTAIETVGCQGLGGMGNEECANIAGFFWREEE